MKAQAEKRDFIRQWQRKIDTWQGLGKSLAGPLPVVGPFDAAFPDKAFPVAAVHEFRSYGFSEVASTQGFIAALCSKILKEGQLCLWIGGEGKVFPPALTSFGMHPSRIVFADASRLRDRLWMIEEALRCEALSAVIGEIPELGFTESRRLQLAVEKSGVCCFLHRQRPQNENNVACTTRWHITPLPSLNEEGLPGVGHPCWDVRLLKVRNGRPGSWQLGWSEGNFIGREMPKQSISFPQNQAG